MVILNSQVVPISQVVVKTGFTVQFNYPQKYRGTSIIINCITRLVGLNPYFVSMSLTNAVLLLSVSTLLLPGTFPMTP